MNSLPFSLTALGAFETALVLGDILIDVEEIVVCSLLCQGSGRYFRFEEESQGLADSW